MTFPTLDLAPAGRIVVVSDTHMPRMAKGLPVELCRALESADCIIHAGDFVTDVAVQALEAFAPVVGVAGNNDDAAIQSRFPVAQLLEWNGFRIGLAHGHEGRGASTPARARNTFRDAGVDAIVFGHSHVPMHESRDGIVLFNPGSPTDRRRQPQFSYGWLEATVTLDFRLVYYDSKAW